MSPQTDPNASVEVYKESDSFVPNPTHQYGTMDTSGTAGAAHAKLENVTPIFEVAQAQNAIVAKAALDPDRPDVPDYLVTMPPGQNIVPVDTEAIKQAVIDKGTAVEENPIVVGGPSPYQQAAAEEGTSAGGSTGTTVGDAAATSTTATPRPVTGTQSGAPQTQPPASGTQS